MSRVAPAQRFTAAHPCPVCGGYDGLPRGEGIRCAGFRSDDGGWAHCTREELAPGLRLHGTSQTYAHRLDVPCRCGRAHDAAPRPPAARSVSNGHAPTPRLGEPVARYDYRAPDGRVVHRTLRYDPKRFSQCRPDPDRPGAWLPNLDSVDLVLYRLPEIQGQADVVVVEGEKDAEALATLGFAASCNSMGAGKWRPAYTQQLVAAGVQRVAVVPDNDHAGQAHAAAVAASCATAGLRARVVALPGLPPVRERHGEDVSDWLAQGHPADELRGALRAMASEASALATSRGPAPVLVRLSDIAPEDVSWLWPGRLARGKFTMLAGDPGLGKSFVTLDAAARITTGQCWPDGGAAPRGDVILLSAEDGAADTIRPRVDAMGGDCDRIHILQAVRQADAERSFSLAHDLPALDQAIAQTRATLLVIDPLSAYLGKTDSYKDAEVRGLLAPLATLATHHGTAVLLVMHLTKNNQTRAIYRPAGSIAFVAGARVSLLVGKDPDDEARRLLVANKNNLTVASAALAYRIVGGPEPGRGAARVEWEPDPVIGAPDADALLAGSAEDPEDRRDADALLLEELANGARPSNDLFRAARANSISESTLNRAKRRLRIRARHQGQPGKSGGAWYWHLPEPPLSPSPPKDVIAVPPKGVIPTEVTPFEELEDKTDEIPHASPKGVIPTEVTPFEDPLGRGGTLRSRPPVAGEERL